MTPVLIVGAGPVGLATACSLLRRGVPVRVLEQSDQAGQGSRAILLWRPALELLADLGLADDAIDQGLRPAALHYHVGDGVRVPLDAPNRPLLLPQDRTDRLLEEALHRLGCRVERGVRVTDVEIAGGSVTVKALGETGVESIEADWLIAADGVGSTVRQCLGIDFPGVRVPATFLLAEAHVSGDLDRTELHYWFGPRSALVITSLPGGAVRIAAPIPPDTPLTEATVQKLLDERGPRGLRLEQLIRISAFESQERIATTMRKGPCFLAGDAAHTHSVIGGQGLNLGLQDVRNLTWKLAGVVHGTLEPNVLDTYGVERRHAAEEVVRFTGRLMKLAMLGPRAARVRDLAFRTLQVTGVLRRRYAPVLAGWRVRLPPALLGDAVPRRAARLPRPGARTPYWTPAPQNPHDTCFRLLTLGPQNAPLPRRAADLAETLPGVLAHEHHPARRTRFLLLRPDGHVALSGRTTTALEEAEHLLNSLTRQTR
ncbi:FAD-dependent oxidoreductase [Actinomadura sp. KC06]|uniref:FAD-dependent oxidoreductase n=1 Tax=Actinomadura sp. KC06 TaxID=2530369 RepID=UPI00104BAD2F|nr:FAD-dependent oxidoreductase [Actinomadura sp. KC06]TDD30856.1 FAD-dependent oxidoreductase [Actinomadura sp. KC06]